MFRLVSDTLFPTGSLKRPVVMLICAASTICALRCAKKDVCSTAGNMAGCQIESKATNSEIEMKVGVDISKDQSGMWVVSFSHGPNWVHALRSHDPSTTKELTLGLWLVVVFAVWSSSDIMCVHTRHGGSQAIRFSHTAWSSAFRGIRGS